MNTARANYTYSDYYADYITPKLEEIDIFIKTSGQRIECLRAAEILELPPAEVFSILAELRGFKSRPIWLRRPEFFEVMERGSSPICGLYRREVECGSPPVYSRDQIAYIYGIDVKKIDAVCDSMCLEEMPAYMLPQVFDRVVF